jgi:hypothetical protein
VEFRHRCTRLVLYHLSATSCCVFPSEEAVSQLLGWRVSTPHGACRRETVTSFGAVRSAVSGRLRQLLECGLEEQTQREVLFHRSRDVLRQLLLVVGQVLLGSDKFLHAEQVVVFEFV